MPLTPAIGGSRSELGKAIERNGKSIFPNQVT
jgi:hypothetical protein